VSSRAPHVLVEPAPARTIVVYCNGDPFYVGRKFALSRRPVATFEALLEQLTEQVEVPFGARRLFTPTRGRPVNELDALQAGGKYVAAGRERFRKLDYFNIVPSRPARMRKLKGIKPVVHCDINVPPRWRTSHRLSRQINVFTNGRLFIPPVKIIIPKFSLTDSQLIFSFFTQRLFTMNGHLLDNSKDLQDNHFYVAAGLEAFRYFPSWKSPKVPGEEDPKVKEAHKYDNVPPKALDSIFYAKEGKKKPKAEPFIHSGAGNVKCCVAVGNSKCCRVRNLGWAREPWPLSLRIRSLCSTMGEATAVRGLRTAKKKKKKKKVILSSLWTSGRAYCPLRTNDTENNQQTYQPFEANMNIKAIRTHCLGLLFEYERHLKD
uniref:Doublecortin domain containing 2C n=1 Tax=Phocoena sinus TaxID=42100 RepID=A0A8C9EFG1_PHOSS